MMKDYCLRAAGLATAIMLNPVRGGQARTHKDCRAEQEVSLDAATLK